MDKRLTVFASASSTTRQPTAAELLEREIAATEKANEDLVNVANSQLEQAHAATSLYEKGRLFTKVGHTVWEMDTNEKRIQELRRQLSKLPIN